MKNSLIASVLRHPTSEPWRRRTDEFGAALGAFHTTQSESLQTVMRTLHYDTVKAMGGSVLATLSPGFVIYDTGAVPLDEDILLYKDWERSSLRLYQKIEPFRLQVVDDIILYPEDGEYESPTAGIVLKTPMFPSGKTYMARTAIKDVEIVALPDQGRTYGE